MGATHWQEDSAKLDSPPHVFQCLSSFPHSPLPVSACLCCVIKFLPELASCDQLLVLRNLFYSFTAPNVIQTTPYVRIRLIFCYDIISDPFYPPFPAPYCVNVTTKCFVWCRTQVYGSHRDVLCLVRAHKTLWIMSWDTLCILNQFVRSVISIIAGVWHGGQTLSALCSALLKGLAHRKITLESKYWLKRFYVLWTICSPWTMSQVENDCSVATIISQFFRFSHRGCVALRTSPLVLPPNFLCCFSGFLSFFPFL